VFPVPGAELAPAPAAKAQEFDTKVDDGLPTEMSIWRSFMEATIRPHPQGLSG